MKKSELKIEYNITENGKVIKTFTDEQQAIAEITKSKYLVGFNSLSTKYKDDRAEAKIERYLEDADPDNFDSKKASRVMVDRIHRNITVNRRIQLTKTYTISSPTDSD